MNKEHIVQKGHPALEAVSAEVTVSSLPDPTITDIITRMKAAMDDTEDGVAIAAPQIGENVRIFLVSEKVFDNPEEEDLVYINPVITKRSKRTHTLEEGCLSVRGIYGHTERYRQVTVEAYNEFGEKFERGGGGLLAQIFQHEIDHLDGILFDSHADNLREIEVE